MRFQSRDRQGAGPTSPSSGGSARSAGSWPGPAADPSTRNDGDSWYNSTQQGRKGAAAGRVHTQPQVLCSSTGASTSATSSTRLGSCTFPGNFLRPGDRVDIRFDYSHEGTETGFTIEVRWGGSPIVTRGALMEESQVTGKADAGIHALTHAEIRVSSAFHGAEVSANLAPPSTFARSRLNSSIALFSASETERESFSQGKRFETAVRA